MLYRVWFNTDYHMYCTLDQACWHLNNLELLKIGVWITRVERIEGVPQYELDFKLAG